MDWMMEHELAELARIMRVLTVRFILAERWVARSTRAKLALSLARKVQRDGEQMPISPLTNRCIQLIEKTDYPLRALDSLFQSEVITLAEYNRRRGPFKRNVQRFYYACRRFDQGLRSRMDAGERAPENPSSATGEIAGQHIPGELAQHCVAGLSVANSESDGNRSLEQTATVLPPSVATKQGSRRRGCAGPLRGCRALQRTMNAMHVIVVAEFTQLARQVHRVPEEDSIEVLTPDRADQPFDERMRDWRVRY